MSFNKMDDMGRVDRAKHIRRQTGEPASAPSGKPSELWKNEEKKADKFERQEQRPSGNGTPSKES